MNLSYYEDNTPHIAVFWYANGTFIGPNCRVADGKSDDGYIFCPGRHSDLWKAYGLSEKYPYDYFPRGAIVYGAMTRAFYVIGDERLISDSNFRKNVKNYYNLPEDTTFTSKIHYNFEDVWDDGTMKDNTEMARVGITDRNYEVYVNTDDRRQLPHFHYRKADDYEAFHTCIQITEPEYFSHGGQQYLLHSEQISDLIKFLNSSPNRGTRYSSNWQLLIDMWNSNNDICFFDMLQIFLRM